MKEVKYMRKDPSCLLTRVLYELSATVCIEVTSAELGDFGIEYDDEDEKKQTDEKKGKNNRRKRKIGRIKKLKFEVVETKENMVLCNATSTLQTQLTTMTQRHDDSWKSFNVGDKIFIRHPDDSQKYTVAEIKRLKKKSDRLMEYDNLSKTQRDLLWDLNTMEAIYIHYLDKIPFEEWVFIEPNTLCDCDGNVCSKKPHRIKSKAILKQNRKSRKSTIQNYSEEKQETQYDNACNTFILGGLQINGYCQMFPKSSRSSATIKEWRGKNEKNKNQVVQFLIELNTKYIIEWQQSFVDSGIGFLAQAITNKCYDQYKQDEALLAKSEAKELATDKVEKNVDAIIRARQLAIRDEFHENYTSKAYCKKEHGEISEIYTELSESHTLSDDLAKPAKKYVQHESAEEMSLPSETSSWWDRTTCLDKMKSEVTRILKEYKKHKKTSESKNKVIREWVKLYKQQSKYYRNHVYSNSPILRHETVKKTVKYQIKNKYAQKRRELKGVLETAIQNTQFSKPENMETTTLTKCQKNIDNEFTIIYTLPTEIPPSYQMQFISIDLANIKEEIKFNPMKNMSFEMLQSQTLIFHQMIAKSGDMIMFIREDDDEMKTSQTKIIASRSRVLRMYQEPLVILKAKRVEMVAYCEAQKLFAILMHGRLAFCKFQDQTRISFTKTQSELELLTWWDKNLKFKAMLVEEVNKNMYVWLIDEYNVVRAFDYDSGSWDTAKTFKLDQDYQSYQLSPTGSFLIAFKHQYKKDTQHIKKITNEANDEKKDDASKDNVTKPSTKKTKRKRLNKRKKSIKKKKIPTGRIELHTYLLSEKDKEKKKLKYAVHKSSTTGYEHGDEKELKENDESSKIGFQIVDNVLLPETFNTNAHVKIDRLHIMETNTKDEI
eukprot:435735_1